MIDAESSYEAATDSAVPAIISSVAFCSMSVMRSPLHPLAQPLRSIFIIILLFQRCAILITIGVIRHLANKGSLSIDAEL